MTAMTPLWEGQESFPAYYDHEAKGDMTGGPNRASTLSISHLPFVLFSAPERAKARHSTKSLLPSDVDAAFPFTPITPPPPLPMLRQSSQKTLAQPLNTPRLSTRTASDSEPRLPRPHPSASVLPTVPSLPKPPQPLPMATPAVPMQGAPKGRPMPHNRSVSSSSGPRVRPLPQRPPTAKPIEDESLGAEPDGKIGRSNSTPVPKYDPESDSNALRRNRHIRRPQKATLSGPRPLPPLPGTSPNTSIVVTELNAPTFKRVSSPTQPAPPRILTSLHRSRSDPISPPPYRKPNLSLVIPKSQTDSRGRHLPQQEPQPTAPSSCEDESSGLQHKKSQSHSLHYFPTIDYASAATPSASRRPPPSAYPESGKDNSALLDWHLLEEALGIDGDVDVVPTASPVMLSFLPSPTAPPVPTIPDRFLVDREYRRTVSQALRSNLTSASVRSLEESKSRRAVDSLLAMVVDYERELLYQFPTPPSTVHGAIPEL